MEQPVLYTDALAADDLLQVYDLAGALLEVAPGMRHAADLDDALLEQRLVAA